MAYTEKELIEGLLAHDPKCIHEIYRKCQPKVIRMVKKNSGSQEDGQDFFQRAIVILYKMAKESGFQLTSKICTLLYGIAWNLLKDIWRKNKRESNSSDQQIQTTGDNQEDQIILDEGHKRIWEAIKRLSQECQEILTWFSNKVPFEEIAFRLQISENLARQKKFRCLNRLRGLLGDDQYFD